MVRHHVDRSWRSFEIVSPNFKSFEDGEQFLIVDVVVEFGGCKRAGVEGNGVDFIVRRGYGGENRGEGVVLCVRFDDERRAWNPMRQYWRSGEGFLQRIKGGAAFVGEVPSGSFAGEARERNSDVGVVRDEAAIEVGEPQEGLYVFDLAGFGPILNDLDLIGGHGQAVRR